MTGEIKDDVTKNIFRLVGISGLKFCNLMRKDILNFHKNGFERRLEMPT